MGLPKRKNIQPNIKSGITVSLIAIPLSISLAVASGATPLQGIITAIWACMIAGFVGGSNYNIFGPAGALTALLMAFYSNTQDVYTLPLLAIVTGLRAAIIRSLKLTKYITLIPSTALHGFIAGVSLIIAFGQLPNILGIYNITKHSNIISNIIEIASNRTSINITSVGLFILGLVFLIVWKNNIKKIPGPIPLAIIGIILGRCISQGLLPLSVQVLADQFPNLQFSLIQTQRRHAITSRVGRDYRDFRQTLGISGFIIAIISILETIISAKIADKLTHTKCKQHKEVLGVSMANIGSGLAGGLPATAVLIRTALNVKSGATSRISAVIAGAAVLCISWLGFEYFVMLPMPIIAAILVNIAIGLLDIKLYQRIYSFDRLDAATLIIVALITFMSDPIYGVLTGVSISLLNYLKRSTQSGMTVTLFRDHKFIAKMPINQYHTVQKPDDLIVIKFSTQITFLSITSIEKAIDDIKHSPTIVLSLGNVLYIDMDGIEALSNLVSRLDTQKINYYFSSIPPYIQKQLEQDQHFNRLIQENKIYDTSAHIMNQIL